MSHAKALTDRPFYTEAQRLLALFYGIACHLFFVAAIAVMAWTLWFGWTTGYGPFRGPAAWIANLLLLASFPVIHSWWLSASGRRVMVRLAPAGLGRPLSSTLFALLSSLHLLLVFLAWSPSGTVWARAEGLSRILLMMGAGGSWLLLLKAMSDAQLALQTGFLGWWAVFRNRDPSYKPFATQGVYRIVRQPIYIAFALVLWCASIWTPDQVVTASLWSVYCVVGSTLKERRYRRMFGEPFRAYQTLVPFWIPGWGSWKRAKEGSVESSPNSDSEVCIIGAGPVGLLLALLLGRRGCRVVLLERRTEPIRHSLAIGVTPPSLAVLRRLGLDEAFVSAGVPIETARIHEDGELLGSVRFHDLPSRHRCILSVPQAVTIRLLERALEGLPNVELRRGIELLELSDHSGGVTVRARHTESEEETTLRATYVVGCDGHRSHVRKLLGIRSRGHYYPCRFVMADFSDAALGGSDAHLFFGPEGSVESFPLPDGRRRWIVQEKGRVDLRGAGLALRVAQRVRERTGFDLDQDSAGFESGFQPMRFCARRFGRGRVWLCGDAAHVLSPIGGQGMNTGFADAAYLDRALNVALRAPRRAPKAFRSYEQVRRKAWRMAATRAAQGMWMGTRTGAFSSRIRRWFITHVLLKGPIADALPSRFAMLTLPGWNPPRPITSTPTQGPICPMDSP